MTFLAAPPQVVGTINAKGLTHLADAPAVGDAADIVEARFDLAIGEVPGGHTRELPIPAAFFASCLASCARLERSGTPVLATLRLVADGGRWTDDAARLPWLDQALAVTSWADIELESAIADQVVRLAHARGRQVIVSHHDFTGTREVEALSALIERARGLGADIVKLATAVDSLEAHDRLIELMRAQRASPGAPVALVGMGPIGTPLRSYLPCVGSRLTYGYLDAVAAPGQIHAGDLVRRLIADCPSYADHRRRQGRL
jgi:3-dehydroquinate dehydratase-1